MVALLSCCFSSWLSRRLSGGRDGLWRLSVKEEEIEEPLKALPPKADLIVLLVFLLLPLSCCCLAVHRGGSTTGRADRFDDDRPKRSRFVAQRNKEEGEAFLAANLLKPGIKALPSGLQYKVLKSGDGKTPRLTDTVVVHFRGRLISGRAFLDTRTSGEPKVSRVDQMLKGLIEAH